MIKKLHYIKEDYSGNIEKYCLNSYKALYPDFEFVAWKPNSSPLRILYDHGGLFIGPNFLALNKIPDNFLQKPFLSFDNSFETVIPNLTSVCFSDEPKAPIFLEFMEKGVLSTLREKGFSGGFKSTLAESDYSLDEINILNRNQFGGFDKALKFPPKPDCFVTDMNTGPEIKGEWNLHYLIINKDTESNKVFSLCENFSKMKYEDESKHFILLVCNDLERDLCVRMAELLNYHLVTENKKYNMIVVGNGADEKKVSDIITEYVGRKFEKILSCERLL